MAGPFHVWDRLVAREKRQDVDEEEDEVDQQVHGCGHVLVDVPVVQHLRRVVEDPAPEQDGDDEREEGASGESEASAPVTTAAPATTTAAPEPIPTPSTTETPGEFEPVGTDLTTPLPTGDVARGEQLFDAPSPVGFNCANCHTLADASLLADPSLLDLQGPALFGIADRAGTTREGYSSEEYLRESILLPAEFLTEGYPITVMPRTFGEQLDAQDLADLIAFLMTQSG